MGLLCAFTGDYGDLSLAWMGLETLNGLDYRTRKGSVAVSESHQVWSLTVSGGVGRTNLFGITVRQWKPLYRVVSAETRNFHTCCSDLGTLLGKWLA